MKKILYSLLIALAIISCGDDEIKNPNYPVEPSIRFKDIQFIEATGPFNNEALEFTITYKDGDSDLGLTLDHTEITAPHHALSLFLEDGTGDTLGLPVSLEMIPSAELPIVIVKPVAQRGTLVSSKTREKPEYEYLPEYDPMDCQHYTFLTYFLDEDILDESFNIDRTTTVNGKKFMTITDLLFFVPNRNFYNIYVQFYYFDNGNFVEYDWYEYNCQDYNGRFPIIDDKKSGTIEIGGFKVEVKNPWEGQITYTMVNSSFLAVFGSKRLKLAITIKDRALHSSNTVVTQEFTLQDIQQ